MWLPEGAYRFRADQYDLPFWSSIEDHCAVPGCDFMPVYTYAYGTDARQEQEILYTYDDLNRLTAADYSSGIFYHYAYDEVGNRLSQEINLDWEPVTTTYAYDEANRLTQVGDQDYTWDANGNLLDDGQRQYSYDAANRLTALTDEEHDYTYAYNGLGDRVSQSIDGVTEIYQLDLNAGLTQVLSDSANTYLYGQGRIAQDAGDEINNFLLDGLGSVRTVVSGEEIALVRDYAPYGEELASAGSGASAYGYAGERTDASGMQYLRARYYAPSVGRFVSRDSYGGNTYPPSSMNRWVYVSENSVNLTNPSGFDADCGVGESACGEYGKGLWEYYLSENELLKDSKIPFSFFVKGYEAYTYYETRPKEAVIAMLNDSTDPNYTSWGYVRVYVARQSHLIETAPSRNSQHPTHNEGVCP